ncbi:hypothetical protein M9Y10_016757 [Tritrichomonas musculus]|uniref:Uncharacterized protein n=1 Tax=Tritrichomonas musculus TaxID=1915356 RepID=A0ABR2HXU9_9EUKA
MNTYGLNINLQSFFLNRSLYKSGDKIRVSITTVPEEIKEAFVVDSDKTSNIHYFFTTNITSQTKKIIFVFRRKSFIYNDPIIASTIVHVNDLPRSATDTNNTEMKQINIYEPVQKTGHSAYAIQNRKIFGQMEIQFMPENAFPSSSFKKNSHSNGLEMVTLTSTNKTFKDYGHVSNENQNEFQAYGHYDDQNTFADVDPEQIKNLHQFDNISRFHPQNQNQNELNDQQQNQYQLQQQNQYQYRPQQQNQNQQQPQNQYQPQQQQQNQYQPQQQNQCQPQQQNTMVFVNDLI